MKEGQEHIYYLLAPSLAAAAASPHLEAFRKKGIEVLLLGEDVDNWVGQQPARVRGQAAAVGGAGQPSDLSDCCRTRPRRRQGAGQRRVLSGLVSQLKAVLAGQAYDVRVSSRLTTSPACIVANEAETEINLARRLRGSGLPIQPVLEINPQHPAGATAQPRACRPAAGRVGARPVQPGRAHPGGSDRGSRRLRQPG